MKGVMIQGTSSDCGKSFITTALCRIFSNKGYKVCPFKSQNMSNNSYITKDGREMGRAQGVQAEAARVDADVFMNPILLKPRGDMTSEIVLFGKVSETPCDANYFRTFTMNEGLKAVREALSIVAANFDLVVAEGAGSPAEVNLQSAEIVNMRVAREADIPVILVTDVDRGGSMASVVGTLELLGDDRKRVKGIIFNKFRGNIELFKNAAEWTEKYTGIKVVGVMPMVTDVTIEAEDSLSFNTFEHRSDGCVNIGVVKFPRVSNHTDIEPFRFERDVRVSRISPSDSLENYDGVILPGTKSTIDDLNYLKSGGLAEKLQKFGENGGFVFGICGGYQMLGEKLFDPNLTDNAKETETDGIGLLPVYTEFVGDKTTLRKRGKILHPAFGDACVDGYEIHFGRTRFADNHAGFSPLLLLDGAEEGACSDDGHIVGTYLHNAFHNDELRNRWLNKIRRSAGLPEQPVVNTASEKERAYEKIAEQAQKHLDIEFIEKICGL